MLSLIFFSICISSLFVIFDFLREKIYSKTYKVGSIKAQEILEEEYDKLCADAASGDPIAEDLLAEWFRNGNQVVYENIDDFFSKNKGTYYFLTRYGKKTHTSFDYSNKDENIYFIFGKESTGIPTNILKPYLDNCMRMPMTDNVRALNLSNTVAIMVYEALRQQDYRDLLFEEPHKSADFIEETG